MNAKNLQAEAWLGTYVLMKVKKNLNKIFVLFLTALATGAFYA
jgi:hypothetical protein